MSPILRDIARDMVPRRTPKGTGWSAPDQELITVVCRDGAPVITPTDSQFYRGWRYSNHLTMAFDGDVYAVTPTGWVGLDGCTGTTPTFTAEDDASGGECDVLVFPPLQHDLMYPDDHECDI